MKINSEYCLNLMKSRYKLDSFLSFDYSVIGNFLISISVFTVIQFSRNSTFAEKDLMLVMVFPIQLERDFLDCEF